MPPRTDQAPSIRRALELHQGRGIVRDFRSWTEPGRPRRWVVAAYGIGTQEFTDAEALAFCLGLAAAHQRETETAAAYAFDRDEFDAWLATQEPDPPLPRARLIGDLPALPAGAWVRVTTANGGEGVFRLERDHRAGQTLVADRMRVDVPEGTRVIETRTRIDADRIVSVLVAEAPA